MSPIVYAIGIAPIASRSLPWFLIAGFLGPLIFYWVPVLDLCARPTRFYAYRPNPYIDTYDDPRSRLWLVPDSARRSIAHPETSMPAENRPSAPSPRGTAGDDSVRVGE